MRPAEAVTAADLAPLVEMAMAAVAREYPYHFSVVLHSDADLGLPRTLTPAFRGAFDWHSAVHGHWTLVRALRRMPEAPWAPQVRECLNANLSTANLYAEQAFLFKPGRDGWERPYGHAWLLQLFAELQNWNDEDAKRWWYGIWPMVRTIEERIAAWLEKLPWPVRSGEHSQSAFALGLVYDWTLDCRRPALRARIVERAVELYGNDRNAPLAYEPSGHDFLSPILGEADLLRRCMAQEAYAAWLEHFLPPPDSPELERWLTPVTSPDRSDGKLAHLDGLNLSRAWMLEGVLSALPADHALVPPLRAAAEAHRAAGLAGLAGGDWMGTHWLASFAMYLVTGRGLSRSRSTAID